MITERQLRLLSEAVPDAQTWRGNLVGAAPDYAIEAFDRKIERMRQAVKAAREDLVEIKALRAQLAQHLSPTGCY